MEGEVDDQRQSNNKDNVLKTKKKSKPPRKQAKGSDNDNEKKQKKKRKKQKKVIRACSPAAYPSPLPIFFEDSSTNDSSHGLVNGEQINEKNSVALSKVDEGRASGLGAKYLDRNEQENSFFAFRIHYLIIHIAIMLADGLQGTHLYVLYESYGYTVASLYCLGFVSGAITSPFIGPLVDKVGRRTSAIAYCVLEIFINLLEQYHLLAGLIVSRVIGGITTNLLFTVFESWLVTEHRRRGFSEDKLEIVLRDSVVAANLSAIASGCLSHALACHFGMGGPFMGAVVCTFVALLLVMTRWEENYGSDVPGVKTVSCYMKNAFFLIISDSKILRVGLIQGLTEGAVQTFVFLWSPALRHLARQVDPFIAKNIIGIDTDGEPTYGLIFGAFMLCGAMGGMSEPFVRKAFGYLKVESDPESMNGKVMICTDISVAGKCNTDDEKIVDEVDVTVKANGELKTDISDVTEESDDYDLTEEESPIAAVVLGSICYTVSALLLATPVFVDEKKPYAFTASLIAFLLYEVLVGLYLPCEGVLRSVFIPNDSICSLMTMLRVIVNVAVALGVISTNYIPFGAAFAACSGALVIAAILQLTLVEKSEWRAIYSKLFSKSTSAPKADELNVQESLGVADSSLSISFDYQNQHVAGKETPSEDFKKDEVFQVQQECNGLRQRKLASQ